MKIVFDTQIFGMQEYGGISRYFCGLVSEMQGIDGVDAQIIAPMHINCYLEEMPVGAVYGSRTVNRRAWSLGRRLVSGMLCDFRQRRMKPDIVHKTYYHLFPGAPAKAKVVTTVYDMIQERFPGDFPPGGLIAKLKRIAVRKADHVICISENTRRDLLSMYDVSEERVSVVVLGFDPLMNLDGCIDASTFRAQFLGDDRPYLLFVGRRPGYKNFDGLLEAYASSQRLRREFAILCFGGGDFTREERRRMSELGVGDSIRYLSGGDTMLANSYRHAALFVFPSKYEGFGIPPLEAMSVGCPVACSDVSSIPEVVGDAGAYFPPDDPAAIRDTVERVLDSDHERSELIRRGKHRCVQFSWRKCAQDTLGIYRSMVKQ